MKECLGIRARLPRPASLELCARLLAARPYWDVELDEEGLSFIIPLIHGQVNHELTILEEACRKVEATRGGLEIDLDVGKTLANRPDTPSPYALGPWRLLTAAPIRQEARQAPADNQLLLPPAFRFSNRLWSCEALFLTALTKHLTPRPGAPETKGRPSLIMESALPLAPLAAHRAGAGPISLITDEQSAPALFDLLTINLIEQNQVECLTLPFKTLSRKPEGWAGRFGLIAAHLSPYLISRRLQSLARWLQPDGALIIGGFTPGAQTAQLLRGAAKAGLELSESINNGPWAAMTLRPAPKRENLLPLTGSVVPGLVDLPPEESAPATNVTAGDDLVLPEDPENLKDATLEEESLLIEEEEEEEE